MSGGEIEIKVLAGGELVNVEKLCDALAAGTLQMGHTHPDYQMGVVPPDITMADIYRSVVPFVIIQGICLVQIMMFPELVLWLPTVMLGGG